MILKYIRHSSGIKPIARCFHLSTPFLNKSKTTSSSSHESKEPLSGPPIDENGLYYGQFTKEEYEKAAKYVKDQYSNLESSIKGTTNIRENLANMPAFPSIEQTKGGIKVDNLSKVFEETIKTTGPLSLLSFMRQCLTHPEYGYYTTRDPLDAKLGDFITSPEISSMFGEMIGIWLYSTWNNQNNPKNIRLIEFGPGKGTLIHDCLISFNKFVKNANIKKEIILIEASHVLRQEQWKLLCGVSNEFKLDQDGFNYSVTKWGDKIWWVDTEKDIDIINAKDRDDNTLEKANYIIAHEFFDALPIKSFVKKVSGWRELLVEHTPSVKNTQQALPPADTNPIINSQKDQDLLNADFHLTLSPSKTPSSIIPTINSRYANLPVESRIEICPDSELYLAKMIQLLQSSSSSSTKSETKGSILIVDYGLASEVPSNSLRGIYKHKIVSPFIKPGEVDLSIDVDFQNLKDLLIKAETSAFGPVDQGDWLHECGIGYRTDQLIKANANNVDVQEKIYNAYKRLTDKEEGSMGKIYKFLCIMPNGSKPPVGFGGNV